MKVEKGREEGGGGRQREAIKVEKGREEEGRQREAKQQRKWLQEVQEESTNLFLQAFVKLRPSFC